MRLFAAAFILFAITAPSQAQPALETKKSGNPYLDAGRELFQTPDAVQSTAEIDEIADCVGVIEGMAKFYESINRPANAELWRNGSRGLDSISFAKLVVETLNKDRSTRAVDLEKYLKDRSDYAELKTTAMFENKNINAVNKKAAHCTAVYKRHKPYLEDLMKNAEAQKRLD